MMTKDEFEAAYAKRSGMTLDQLRALGMYGKPCDCGEDGCAGWQMTNKRREADDALLDGLMS